MTLRCPGEPPTDAGTPWRGLGPAWEDGLWAATAVLDAVLLVLDAVLLVAGLTLAVRGTIDLRHALTPLPFELKSCRLIPWIG